MRGYGVYSLFAIRGLKGLLFCLVDSTTSSGCGLFIVGILFCVVQLCWVCLVWFYLVIFVFFYVLWCILWFEGLC